MGQKTPPPSVKAAIGPWIITPDSASAPCIHINQKAAFMEPDIQALFFNAYKSNCPDKVL